MIKLGKLQQEWVKNLRKYPERQTANFLGEGTPKNYKACCLGELLLTDCRLKKKKMPFYSTLNTLESLSQQSFLSEEHYKSFGLNSDMGGFKNEIIINNQPYKSLASLNDNGISWPRIADIVEANPDNVFYKSV